MNERVIVTGTDTGIGKTVFAAALAARLDAAYWKPIQAGLQGETDSDVVRRLGGLPAERIVREAYRLALPASPHIAAAAEGVAIDPGKLQLPDTRHPLVIEGAGGLLVPLAPGLLQIDQFRTWGAPIILCARTALGTINHTLLSLEALRVRRMAVLGVAFVGDCEAEVERTIVDLGAVRHLGRLPRIDPLDTATLRSVFDASFACADMASWACR